MHRLSDDEVLSGILDALTVELALLESGGQIIRVNKAWRDFASANGAADTACGPGANYLAICDAARGENAAVAQAVAAGIRAVLRSDIEQFSTEYPCHLPAEERWFEIKVTPYAGRSAVGAVVMHADITARRTIKNALRASEAAVKRLNRVYTILSGINALILHVRDRDELFREACRIAVEDGGFCMALIHLAGPDGQALIPAAWSGVDDDFRRKVGELLASPQGRAMMGPRALSGRTAIVSNDVPNDRTLALGDEYAARGVRSMAALPLAVGDRPLGLLMLYASEQDFFHDAEIKLLVQLGDNIAFAVDHIRKVERTQYLAYFDDCTGLANRRLFLERLSERLAAATRAGAMICVIFFDLGRFKSINDTFGREAGDSLLRQVADWLKAHIEDETRVARVGPDQFAVVTPMFVRQEDLMARFATGLAAFQAHLFHFNEAVFRLAIKAGVVIAPDDGTDAEVLLKHAEVAHKQAKKTGMQSVFYKARMSEGATARLTLENQMRQAVDKAEFVLHYQPKIDLATGEMTGSEALIRWLDPARGLTPAGRFIPILEETGLIQEVGRWVLRTAVGDYLRWRAAGFSPGRVAVNVSPLQLRGRDFATEVHQIVGMDAGAYAVLELEITESLIVEDIRNSAASLVTLRQRGVTVAIDDFGTGFSSLSHLARLPVDTLKIDRSFIAEMASGQKELSLVSTIISLAHSLELKVVAEGVETEEQARLLRRLGCDEMQGFLASAALPPDLFEAKYLRPPLLR